MGLAASCFLGLDKGGEAVAFTRSLLPGIVGELEKGELGMVVGDAAYVYAA